MRITKLRDSQARAAAEIRQCPECHGRRHKLNEIHRDDALQFLECDTCHVIVVLAC